MFIMQVGEGNSFQKVKRCTKQYISFAKAIMRNIFLKQVYSSGVRGVKVLVKVVQRPLGVIAVYASGRTRFFPSGKITRSVKLFCEHHECRTSPTGEKYWQ